MRLPLSPHVKLHPSAFNLKSSLFSMCQRLPSMGREAIIISTCELVFYLPLIVMAQQFLRWRTFDEILMLRYWQKCHKNLPNLPTEGFSTEGWFSCLLIHYFTKCAPSRLHKQAASGHHLALAWLACPSLLPPLSMALIPLSPPLSVLHGYSALD